MEAFRSLPDEGKEFIFERKGLEKSVDIYMAKPAVFLGVQMSKGPCDNKVVIDNIKVFHLFPVAIREYTNLVRLFAEKISEA